MKEKEYYMNNKNYKNNIHICICIYIFIAILFSTIGYSAMNSIVSFTGNVALRVGENIRITDVVKSSSVNNALSTYEDFSKNTLSLGTVMPAGSTITYKFTIKNSSSNDYILKSLTTTGTNAKATQTTSLTITNQTSTSILSSGRIKKSTTSTYIITLTNNTTNSITDQRLLTFNFSPIYKITYNLDKGTNDSSNPVEYFTGESITLVDPTSSWYEFIGWTGSNGSTPIKKLSVDTSKGGDLAFSANFEYPTFENGESFNANIKSLTGGSSGENDLIIAINIINSLPSNFTSSTPYVDVSVNKNGKILAYYLDNQIYIYSQATNMYLNNDSSLMFHELTSLTSIDLSKFDTSRVTNMNAMFHALKKLTSLDVSSFDTKNVTNFEGMFWACFKLTSLDLSNFNTSKATTMSKMFCDCQNLESLTLGNKFLTTKVTDMYAMFLQ